MYVGIDIGTGSLKAVLGLKSGIYTITETYRAEMFTPGHHKVEYFRQSLIIFFRNISKYAHSLGEHIDGIGFCGHGPSILLVGDNGSVFTDIITWQDGGAVKYADELKSVIKGFTKDGTSFEAKLLKLFSERKVFFKTGIKAMYPKDYVIYLLTGRMIMDFSTAGTLAFFNTDARTFDTFSTGIPTEIFPEVVDSWNEAGQTETNFSRDCGLADNISVIAGGIDAWSEAIGAGAIENGMMVDGTGTSTCITCCKKMDPSALYHIIPERSLEIETMSSTGASISWLLNILKKDLTELSQINSFDPLPVIFLPYLDGERSPVWDERASASFTGLGSNINSNDLIKSVFQGIAFGTKQCVNLVEQSRESVDYGIRAVGGGAKNKALLQYKANITGIKYIVMKETDAAPLGAMILASYGCGEGSISTLTDQWVKTDCEISPDNKFNDLWRELFTVYKEQYIQLKDVNHSLFEIRGKLEKSR